MPPKKKARKVWFDTDTGGGSSDPSDSDYSPSGGRSKKKAAGSACTTTTSEGSVGSLHQQLDTPQIMGFVSEQELAKFARGMGLKRLMLTDLYQQNDLSTSYCGGQVISHFSSSYSQGHDLGVFIQDESTTQGSQSKHLMVTISEDLAEGVPSLGSDAKLFVHKALVKDDPQAFSQDHGKCLLVEGNEAKVWIVHRNVREPMFFSRTSCGKKWWRKTKTRREKIKSKW